MASTMQVRLLQSVSKTSSSCSWRLASRLVQCQKPAAVTLGAVRYIRTGFFPDDPDFIDPEAPLLAEHINARWRYMDDPSLRANILERSNVGMGMLVLNRAQGLDLNTVNDLYRRLRDVEVNSLKRFVGLTAMEPGPFCLGIDPKELLLAATYANAKGHLPRFSQALMWHSQELAHLVADYRKPLVCYMSGTSRDAGAALCALSSFGGAHVDSEVKVDACFNGLVPTGGMTYVLGSLKWHLGEFLACTGWSVRGPDLVYTGLAQHWLSPEALPFMELTAEKQLEVSEQDARALLDEHSLALPEGLKNGGSIEEGSSIQRSFIPIINKAFGPSNESPIAIGKALAEQASDPNLTPVQRSFAEECRLRMLKASPMALSATLRLIRQARYLVDQGGFKTKNVPGSHSEHGEQGELSFALRSELYAQQRLLCSKDAILGLHARCMGTEIEAGMWNTKFTEVTDLDVDEVVPHLDGLAVGGKRKNREDLGLGKDPRIDPKTAKEPLFAVHSRSEFPLSQHPRLRRFHPDYDEETGLDHDPIWMAQEVARWSPNLFAEERQQALQELLGESNDPAIFGNSRWTRVDADA